MKRSARTTAELLIAIPERWPRARVWRSNTGGGPGREQAVQAVALIRAGQYQDAIGILQRTMKFGLIGSGDITGQFPLLACPGCGRITVPAHQAIDPAACHGEWRKIGVFLSVEVKDQEKMSAQQKNFESACRVMGSPYVVARSCEEGIAGIEFWLASLGVSQPR